MKIAVQIFRLRDGDAIDQGKRPTGVKPVYKSGNVIVTSWTITSPIQCARAASSAWIRIVSDPLAPIGNWLR